MSKPGIEDVGVYIPAGRQSNESRKAQFGIDDAFLEQKIGVRNAARKAASEDTSDLCLEAFRALTEKRAIDAGSISCVVVVTQNPDARLPHVSAILHGKLGLREDCACFDISLGCSGYVHGLSIILAFMEAHSLSTGLLFTADPYSKIVDPEDKNTSLLFGDAATVTLIGTNPVFHAGPFSFGTIGKEQMELSCPSNGRLSMNGHAIFNFAAKSVPIDLDRVLAKAGLDRDEVDRFLLHQGSKYIVDTIAKRAKLDSGKVPFDIAEYGNTVSSSIPILLEKQLAPAAGNIFVLSGFGVGLAYASAVLRRVL